ncbi:MAG: hypothetical protein ACP5XB_15005 [Isosphaeraceae bacterium]
MRSIWRPMIMTGLVAAGALLAMAGLAGVQEWKGAGLFYNLSHGWRGHTCGWSCSASGCGCGPNCDMAGMSTGSMPASGPATRATTTNATGLPAAGTPGMSSDSAAVPAAPTTPTAAATPGAPAQ